MHNIRYFIPYSLQSLCAGAAAALLVAYIGLIAVVISYAAFTVEFSQSVRNDEAAVAVLEQQYLANVARITGMDYLAAGYAKPKIETFVPATNATAVR